jgi:rhamnose transport system permease protein
MSAIGGAATGTGFSARFGRVIRRREIGVAIAIVVVVAIATIVNPKFLFSVSGFENLLLTPSILAVLAVAEAFVIVTKNIDLSISAVLGISAYATGIMFTDWKGVPGVVVIVLAILLGALLGVFNGVLVSAAKVPALVITLGTLYAYRGLDVLWIGSSRVEPGDLPDAFSNLGSATVLGIPVLTIVAVVVVLVGGYFLGYRPAGRQFYAIGSDESAARLYGLPVGRRVFSAFVISGGLAGLAGVMYTARYATVSSDSGTGLELQAVAAAVIGGVAIFGGSGTVVGAFLGAVLLTTIDRVLPTIGVQDFWQQAVVGVLIILAIVLDRLLTLRASRRLTDSSGPEVLAPASPGTEPTAARNDDVKVSEA